MDNINRTTGTVSDGVSGSVRRLVLDPNAKKNSSGWSTLKPMCYSQSSMAVADRVRVCWDLKAASIWFGMIELELYGNSNLRLGEDKG